MIPKTIHFIWLGGKPKSKLTEMCLNTWKRNLPGYEVVEWNEKNLDLDALCRKNRFLKTCVDLRLWAFASDYVRLWILREQGGIYLDADVEAIRPFDPLLNQSMFVGYEADGVIGTGVIGAEKNCPMLDRLLAFYDEEIWNVDFINNPVVFKYVMEREPERFAACRVYPESYFAPYRYDAGEIGLQSGTVEKAESYAVHWYSRDWNLSRKGYVFIGTKHIRSPFRRAAAKLRKNLGYYRRKRRAGRV